jgi:hypothetical protein
LLYRSGIEANDYLLNFIYNAFIMIGKTLSVESSRSIYLHAAMRPCVHFNEELLKGSLDKNLRKLIGSMHPSFMGGEYLPHKTIKKQSSGFDFPELVSI